MIINVSHQGVSEEESGPESEAETRCGMGKRSQSFSLYTIFLPTLRWGKKSIGAQSGPPEMSTGLASNNRFPYQRIGRFCAVASWKPKFKMDFSFCDMLKTLETAKKFRTYTISH